jgi:hypothetical protein
VLLSTLTLSRRTFHHRTKSSQTEKRCNMRDPDGYLIEVGQTTITATPLELYC